MEIELQNFKDRDDLGLFLTSIQSVIISFNPERTINFKILQPVDKSETVLRWNSGYLLFKGVYYSDLELINEYLEYPEFHRSAILKESKLLRETINKLERLEKPIKTPLLHFYLSTDQGNKEVEMNIICESHDLIVNNESKLLTEFSGFDR